MSATIGRGTWAAAGLGRTPIWRTVLLVLTCWLLGLALSMASWALTLEEIHYADSPALLASMLVDLTLGLLALPLLVRIHRRASFPAALGCAALSGFSMVALVGACYAIAAVTAVHPPRRIAILGGVFLASGLAGNAAYARWLPVQSEQWYVLVVACLVFFLVALPFGLTGRSRRNTLLALAREAETARREQAALQRAQQASDRAAQARLDQVRAAERTQIAREMHDALSHELSVISMHSGVLEHRTDLTPEQERDAAAMIADASRRAGSGLRRVLRVLRDGESSAAPYVDLHQLTALLDGVAGAAELTVLPPLTADALASVPRATSRTLYRIVQEALLNAQRHAPGERVSITVEGSPADGVTLRCRNQLPPSAVDGAAGSGLGLVGLAERARLVGGRCTAERSQGEFVVHAWVPWLD